MPAPALLALLPSLLKTGKEVGQMGQQMSGQGLSLASGLLQSLQANKLKKEANALIPSAIDPRQASLLAELQQKRKSLDTGADYAAAEEAIDSSNAGTMEAITRSTGGDVGSTIQALLQSQRNSDLARNNVYAQGAQQQLGYNSLFNNLNNAIAARKLQLGLYQSQQKRAEWAQKQQTANQNLMAGLGMANSGQQPGAQPSAIPNLLNNFPQYGTTGAVNPVALDSEIQKLDANPLATAAQDASFFDSTNIS